MKILPHPESSRFSIISSIIPCINIILNSASLRKYSLEISSKFPWLVHALIIKSYHSRTTLEVKHYLITSHKSTILAEEVVKKVGRKSWNFLWDGTSRNSAVV